MYITYRRQNEKKRWRKIDLTAAVKLKKKSMCLRAQFCQNPLSKTHTHTLVQAHCLRFNRKIILSFSAALVHFDSCQPFAQTLDFPFLFCEEKQEAKIRRLTPTLTNFTDSRAHTYTHIHTKNATKTLQKFFKTFFSSF